MRNILIVIDMQKDFIDGALGTPEAVQIVPNVIELMDKYEPADIYATRDTHPKSYMETREGRFLPVPHCIEGSEGWDIDPEIEERLLPSHIFNKPTFGSEELVQEIVGVAEKEELKITLVGLCTDICVISNALMLHAALPETDLRVAASCCAGVTPEKHEAALEVLRSCQMEIV